MAFRLIFMGSDPIALPALDAVRSGRCGDIEIVAVYTQPDRARGRGKKVVPNEIKQWALEHGYPVCQPEKVKKAERLEIAELAPDSILVMAYGHMLSQALIDTPPCGIWNLHTSLLPKYRGASPIQCAVINGDAETGVSLMQIVREMDAGPILDVERVRIGKLDTALDVETKLSVACVPLLERGLPRVHVGKAFEGAVAQDASRVSFVRKLGKNDGDLDFNVDAAVLAKRVNGLFPWPSARFYYGELAIKVGLADFDSQSVSFSAVGEVLGVDADGLRVACTNGSVLLKRLQRPGGKMLDAVDFARGYDFPVGTVLESRDMPELVGTQPFRA